MQPGPAHQRLALWTALCLQKTAVHYLPDCRSRIKWPNDLMIEDRKNAGILIEPIPGQRQSVVVGIGININNPLPSSSRPDVVERFSWAETNRRFSVPEVLADFLSRWLVSHDEGLPAMTQLNREFDAVDWLQGKRIEVQAMGAYQVATNGELRLASSEVAEQLPATFRGAYSGIDAHGFLRLRADGGTEWVFPSVERVRVLS